MVNVIKFIKLLPYRKMKFITISKHYAKYSADKKKENLNLFIIFIEIKQKFKFAHNA